MVDITRQLELERRRAPAPAGRGASTSTSPSTPSRSAWCTLRSTATSTCDLVLEALNDGIAVGGTIGVPWAGVCRRCLDAADRESTSVAIDELYQKTVIDPDAFLIEDGQLDLNPLVRETALLALDDERLCRPDCAGLCPTCGIDRNVEPCDCSTEVTDPRWAALDARYSTG